MSTNPIFTLRNLTQSYNGRTVLDIDQLDIFQGEILAVVGPSGAGKSTLLRHLNFLERPTLGALSFDTFHLNGEAIPLDLRRKITTVFQNPVLLNRSVADNVAYGLKLRGKNGEQVQRVVTETLDLVGLNSLLDVGAKTLSGGEAQRVALARALVIQPSVLLLDEPTANLDPYNVKLIEQIITQVNRERGTTIVIVTHNVFQARRLAHRTALLLEGRLVEVAETEKFFSNPTDPRTEAFINGEMVY
ncbi:MAG: phosphate ABC transporter ATP-binding protein [Anaerolineae bacterium]|nr:phosphate ABC transporter ATP-binding protein [Anaerolineae bacterium]